MQMLGSMANYTVKSSKEYYNVPIRLELDGEGLKIFNRETEEVLYEDKWENHS